MSRRAHQLTMLLATSLLGGCAYLTNYTRSVDLDGRSAVTMDVK